MSNKRIIIIWGVLDFCSIGWYLVWNFAHAQVPFYADITASINTAQSFGHPMPIIVSSFSLLMYTTLFISGYFLFTRKPIASKIVYVQTPFRLFSLMPLSIFFITWPLKYLFENPKTTIAVITVVFLKLLSESLKTFSVYRWRKQIRFA